MSKLEQGSMTNTTGPNTKDNEELESSKSTAVNKSEPPRGNDYHFIYWE